MAIKNDERFLQKAEMGTLATKSSIAKSDFTTELTAAFDNKADTADSLAGYGIQDAYTKAQVDDAIAASISSTYKPAGSKSADELLALNLSGFLLGNVYNISTPLTTTPAFVDGAGKTYPVGTNVVVVNVGDATNPDYKFDVIPGFVDLSNYATVDVVTTSANGLMSSADKIKLDSFTEATDSEVQTIINELYSA